MDSVKNEIVSPNVELSNRRSFPPSLGNDYIFLRVCVPDLNIQKCFQFCKNQKIIDIKEQCITSLPLVLFYSAYCDIFMVTCITCSDTYL